MKHPVDERPTGFRLILKKTRDGDPLSGYGRFWYKHTYHLCNFQEPLIRFAHHLPLSKAIQIRNLLRAFGGLIPVSRREVFNKDPQYLCCVPVYNGNTINAHEWANSYAARLLNTENDTTKLVIFRDIGMIVLMGGKMQPAKGVHDPSHVLKVCYVYFPEQDKYFVTNSVEVCAYHHIYANYDLYKYGCYTAQQLLIKRFEAESSAPGEYEDYPSDPRAITTHYGLNGPVFGQAIISHPDPSWYRSQGKLILLERKREKCMDVPYLNSQGGEIYGSEQG